MTDGKTPSRQSYLFELKGSATDSLPDWENNGVRRYSLNNITQAEAVRFDGKNFWLCTEVETLPSSKPDSTFETGSISKLSDNFLIDATAFKYATTFSNRGYEAFTFAGKDTICTVSEWPFRYDGRYVRMKMLDCSNKPCKPIGEYAYELDKNSCSPDGVKVDGSIGNGISEMLYIENGRFLIMERCFDGKNGFVKLYETRITRQSTDISQPIFKYLDKAEQFRSLPKQEVFNFNSIKGITVDNLEAMTWGPGKRTLLIVSDNNFYSTAVQKTQWIVLKVVAGN